MLPHAYGRNYCKIQYVARRKKVPARRRFQQMQARVKRRIKQQLQENMWSPSPPREKPNWAWTHDIPDQQAAERSILAQTIVDFPTESPSSDSSTKSRATKSKSTQNIVDIPGQYGAEESISAQDIADIPTDSPSSGMTSIHAINSPLSREGSSTDLERGGVEQESGVIEEIPDLAMEDEMLPFPDQEYEWSEELRESEVKTKFHTQSDLERWKKKMVDRHQADLELWRKRIGYPDAFPQDKPRSEGQKIPIRTNKDPRGYPFKDYDPQKPFRFLDCDVQIVDSEFTDSGVRTMKRDETIRQRILSYILKKPGRGGIVPYYHCYSVEATGRKPQLENFDTSIVIAAVGNRDLVEESTRILYGENTWVFKDSKISLWWLKRIGSNVKKLRKLVIWLDAGYAKPFRTRKEALWHNLLVWLRTRHKLRDLAITTQLWFDEAQDDDEADPRSDPDVIQPRIDVVRTLLKYRGLKCALVKPGSYVEEFVTEILEKAMVLKVGEAATDKATIDLEEDLQEPPRKKYSMA